jgi:uncharacterized RDD family membrane protein YckC
MSTSSEDPHAGAPDPWAIPQDKQPPGYPPGYPQDPQNPQYPGPYTQYSPYGGAMGFPPRGKLATWGPRVGATLLDGLMLVPFEIIGTIVLSATTTSSTFDPDTGLVSRGGPSSIGVVVALLCYVGALAFLLFQLYRQGRTGQTIGKRVVGIRVIRESDGRPTGFGMAIVRGLAHFLDSLPCYLGFLWPLWDSKRQTFADKVCRTVVVLA